MKKFVCTNLGCPPKVSVPTMMGYKLIRFTSDIKKKGLICK